MIAAGQVFAKNACRKRYVARSQQVVRAVRRHLSARRNAVKRKIFECVDLKIVSERDRFHRSRNFVIPFRYAGTVTFARKMRQSDARAQTYEYGDHDRDDPLPAERTQRKNEKQNERNEGIKRKTVEPYGTVKRNSRDQPQRAKQKKTEIDTRRFVVRTPLRFYLLLRPHSSSFVEISNLLTLQDSRYSRRKILKARSNSKVSVLATRFPKN